MTKQLRTITIVIFLMFAALFVASSIIQVFQVGVLNADSRNSRTLLDSYSIKRGAILAGNKTLAESVPSNDQYKYQRKYASPRMYAPVTGYTTVGLGSNGIERAMNPTLTGKANNQFFERISDMVNNRKPSGDTVVTTIKPRVQQAAWDALGDRRGAVIAINPKNGKILAMVSKPSYNPNDLAVHDTKAATKEFNRLADMRVSPLLNAAIGERLNHPGSTFKLVMMATALENGYSKDYTLPNPAALTLKGTTTQIHNDTMRACNGVGNGETTIELALKYSCNIPFAELSLKLGHKKIAEQAKKFGFGRTFNIPQRTVASVFPPVEADSQLQLSAFGQFNVKSAPLQMAMVAGAIANDGKLVQPQLVDEVRNDNMDVVSRYSVKSLGDAVSSETAKTMQKMMLENVQSGAATNARISGVEVGGKTGTAQNGTGQKLSLWFTGAAPISNPKVAVAVVVEDADGFGNEVASPIAQKVMKAVLDK